MRIVVFGTGGIGGYFGGRLAQAGEDVVLIARGEHLQALQNHGLKVDSIEGDFVVQPVQASADPAAVGKADVIIVAVKARQVPEAAVAMQPMIGPDTVVVPLQNGIEAPDQLAAVLGTEHVLGGLCGIMSFIAGPGHIRHAGIGPFVTFGELDNRPSERVERLRQVFEKAQGMKTIVPEDIHAAMWRKFMLIIAVSGVGAVTRAPFGVFRTQPGTRQILQQIVSEAYAIARAKGVNLEPGIVDEVMANIDKSPAGGTASMQRDIMQGRPSELEAQNGAVVRLGQETGVATPVNEFIYYSLLAMELRARGEIEFNI
jgi:2-dehydropantoate 2-reductase